MMNNKIYILFLFIIFFIPFVFKRKNNIENFSCNVGQSETTCPTEREALDAKIPGTNRTCSSWAGSNTGVQKTEGLPKNVPVVYPLDKYWTGQRCVTLESYRNTKNCCTPGINYRLYSFNSTGKTGAYGPTQEDIKSAYKNTSLEGKVNIRTRGVQEWKVPFTGIYKITAFGAGEKCAMLSGKFNLQKNNIIKIVVGQAGGFRTNNNGQSISGGYGGTFVYIDGQPEPLVVAGGSGGESYNSWVEKVSLEKRPTLQINSPNTSGSENWYQGNKCIVRDFNIGSNSGGNIKEGYGGYSVRGGGGAGWKGNGCNSPWIGGSSKPSWKGGENSYFGEGGFGGGGAAWDLYRFSYFNSVTNNRYRSQRAYSGGGGGYSGGPGALGNIYGRSWSPGGGGSYLNESATEPNKEIVFNSWSVNKNAKVNIELISSNETDGMLSGKSPNSYLSISELEKLIYDNRFAPPQRLNLFKARLNLLQNNKSDLESAVKGSTCGLGVSTNDFTADSTIKNSALATLGSKQTPCLNKEVKTAYDNENVQGIVDAINKYPLADKNSANNKLLILEDTLNLRRVVKEAKTSNTMGKIGEALNLYKNATETSIANAKRAQAEIQTILLQNKITDARDGNKLGVLTPALDLYKFASNPKRVEAEELRQQLQSNKLDQLVTNAKTNNSATLTQALNDYKFANQTTKDKAKSARVIIQSYLLNQVTDGATTYQQIDNGKNLYPFANSNSKSKADNKRRKLYQSEQLNNISENALNNVTYGKISQALTQYPEASSSAKENAEANRIIIQSAKLIEETRNVNDITGLNNLINVKYRYADDESKESTRDKIRYLELVRDQSQSLTTAASRAKTEAEIDALLTKYAEASQTAVDSAFERRAYIVNQTNNVLRVAESARTLPEITQVKRENPLASQKAKDLLNARRTQILTDTRNLSNILLTGEYQALKDGLKDYPLATKDVRDRVNVKIGDFERNNAILQKQSNDEELNNIAASSLSVTEIENAISKYQPASDSAVAAARARQQRILNETKNINNGISTAVTLAQLKSLRESNSLASQDAKNKITAKENEINAQIRDFQSIVNTGSIPQIRLALNSSAFSLVPISERTKAENEIQKIEKEIADAEAETQNIAQQQTIAQEDAMQPSILPVQEELGPSQMYPLMEESARIQQVSMEEQLKPINARGYEMGEELSEVRPGFPIPPDCVIGTEGCDEERDKIFSLEEEMRRGPQMTRPMQEQVSIEEEKYVPQKIQGKAMSKIVDDETAIKKGGNIINNQLCMPIINGNGTESDQKKKKKEVKKEIKQDEKMPGSINRTKSTRRPVNINVRYNNNRPMNVNDYGDNNMDISKFIFDGGV